MRNTVDNQPSTRRRGSLGFDSLLHTTQTFFRNEAGSNKLSSISDLSSAQNYLVDVYLKRHQDGVSFSSDVLEDSKNWATDEQLEMLQDAHTQDTREVYKTTPQRTEGPTIVLATTPSKKHTPGKSHTAVAGDDIRLGEGGRHMAYASPIAELERKLQEMRADPLKRTELEQRIALYKSTKLLNLSSFRNFGAENKDVSKYLPEHKQSYMKDSFSRHEEHIAQVLANKEKLNEDLLQHRLAIIHRKEIQASEDQRVAEEEWQRKQRELAQKRWMVLVAFGSRQAIWVQRLQQARLDRATLAKQVKAATTIQRAYRAHYTRTQATRLQRRIAIVYRALRVFIFRFRVRRKNKAADTLRKFLSDIQDTTRIVKVIKRFRFCVSQAQQQWREFAEVERAQLTVLLQQWNRVEREMEGSYHARIEREKAKQAILSKSLFYEGPSSRIRRGMNAGSANIAGNTHPRNSLVPGTALNNKWAGDNSVNSESFPRVPGHIKTQLLLEALHIKKYLFGKQLVEFYNQLAAIDEIHKQRADIARVRQMLSGVGESATPEHNSTLTKPKFILILPKEEVINLINRGITMSLRKPKNSLIMGSSIIEQVASVDIDIDIDEAMNSK